MLYLNRKKLVQINTVVNSGSTGRIAEEIGQRAQDLGWESYIAFGRNEKHSKSHKIKIGTDWDIKYHGLSTRIFDNHGFASKRATRRLIDQLEIIKPEIIHLHNLHGYYLNIELLINYLNKSGIPVVWTLHDCWPITGHCVYFDYIGCDKWKTTCNNCPQKKTYPSSFFIDRSKKNFQIKKELFTSLSNLTLVPVSHWLANILTMSYLQDFPIQVIHNGINTEVFKPTYSIKTLEKYKLEGKFTLLGVASVWSPRKGLKDLIEISRNLNSDYRMIIVGLTKNQINQLPPNIIGIERTDSVEELVELYSASDLFLNPTYEDNFPTTNIESLACGTPVITYKTGGSPEAIDDSAGLIVDKGNIEGMLDAIRHIKQKGKASFSSACINRVNNNFKKEDRYQDYINLYNSML